MKFEYTGRHIEVTPPIRRHVEEHFNKLGHLFDRSSTASAHVIIGVEKNRQIAEVLLHWRDHTLTARDTNADMYQALTRCIDKIEKQALKMKKKIIERKQSAQAVSTLAPEAATGRTTADNPPRNAPRIVNARRYRVKPMTPEEAVLALEEDTNEFVVFRDSDTNSVSVLYKRKDGNYGLIQP